MGIIALSKRNLVTSFLGSKGTEPKRRRKEEKEKGDVVRKMRLNDIVSLQSIWQS